MTEVVVPQPTKVAAFSMRRNANEERIKRDEEELEKLKQANGQTEKKEDVVESDDNLTGEEKTFKKRYGDLRRHSQKVESELKAEIAQLKEMVEKAATNQMRLPARDEDIEAWAKQYPDVYHIVEAIALKKAKETQKGLEERMRQVSESEQTAALERARVELLKVHPDFPQIEQDDDFHDWAEQQPKWIQDAIYENSNDWRSVARAIDLYKVDKAKAKKTTTSNIDAAKAVPTRGRTAPTINNNDGVIYESEVQKMSIVEYEKRQEEINKAIRGGKFVYDITGNAR